ncbi:THAP domain-containing protein 5 [Neodiprion fabricii]|uniref:THAP domain-containing protein 5 n=1 Tax=Neodiprion fabricii TaxID=2872261 RepID=UPI001ED96DEC|nr:THAP domain-containing protein 5 [Neodiprion fabricii]
MVYTCFVCKRRGDRGPRRSFHKFPSNKVQRQQWLDNIGKSDMVVGSRTTICSLHFENSCFRYGLVRGKRLLKECSLPTLYLSTNKDFWIEEKIEDDSMTSVKSNTCATLAKTIASSLSDENEDFWINEEIEDDSMISRSVEPDAYATSAKIIVPSLSDKTSISRLAIKRSGETIEGGIPILNKFLNSMTPERSIRSHLSNTTNANIQQDLLNQRNAEILSLHRQVKRMQRKTLILKADNNNLRRKMKRLENEIKPLRKSVIITQQVSKNKNAMQ